MTAPTPVPTPDPELEPAPSALRNTLILAAVVGALGLFLRFADESVAPSKAPFSQRHRVFALLTAADVTKVEARPATGPAIVLERGPAPPRPADDIEAPVPDAPWDLASPVKDAADLPEVKRALNQLEWLETTEKLEGDQATSYDFGPVGLTLTLEREGKPTLSLEVGEERLGTVPARVPGQGSPVWLVKTDILKTWTAEPWTFRRKEVLPGAGDVERVALVRRDGGGEEVVLTKKDPFWFVGDPQGGEHARRGLIEELLGNARVLRAVGIEKDAPTPADLAAAGLTPPLSRIRLEGAGRPAEALELGKTIEGAATTCYARVEGRDVLYRVDISPLAEALARDRAGWRSDSLFPLAGLERDVSKLEVQLQEGQWILERVDQAWLFEREPRVEAKKEGVEALIKELVGLEVLARLEGPQDDAALGLDRPIVKVGLSEGDLRQEVHIGAPKEGQPGVHHARRVGDARVHLVRVGVLAARLRDAPLDLLGREIFDASSWDAKRIVITDAAGKVLLDASREKKKDSTGFDDWKVAGEPDAVHERVQVYLKAFEHMQTERWEALDSPAARAERGLDRPIEVAVTSESFAPGAAAPADVTKTLLLGKRDGDLIAAVVEGARAIGRIDATFLDRLARGFGKGTPVLVGLERWGVKRFAVKGREGDATIQFTKPDRNWLDESGKLADEAKVEALLVAFEGIDLRKAEPRTPERLAATGLATPRRTFEVTVDAQTGSGQVTKALRLGERANEREVWAMEEGGDVIGLLFDPPVRALDAFVAAREAASNPFPEVPRDPQQPPAPPQQPPPAPPQQPAPPQPPPQQEPQAPEPPKDQPQVDPPPRDQQQQQQEEQAGRDGVELPAWLDERSVHALTALGRGSPGELDIVLALIRALPVTSLDRRNAAVEACVARRMFEWSHWDALAIKLTSADGAVLLDAQKRKEACGEMRRWEVAGGGADPEQFERFALRLSQGRTLSWAALDTPAARSEHGLDRPMTLTITVEAFAEGSRITRTRSLHLGRRDGGRIAARAEGGQGIAWMDARWLDALARGFARGVPVLAGVERWGVTRLSARRGGALALDLVRPERRWFDDTRGELSDEVVEGFLAELEGLELRRAEAATPERLAATGLTSPALTFEVTSRGVGGAADVTRTLCVGVRAGDEVWGREPGSGTIGLLPAAPLEAFEELERARAPFPADAPPVTAPAREATRRLAAMERALAAGDGPRLREEHDLLRVELVRLHLSGDRGQEYAAEVLRVRANGLLAEAAVRMAAPGATPEVPCALCEGAIPATTPFVFEARTSSGILQRACSPGHMEAARQYLDE